MIRIYDFLDCLGFDLERARGSGCNVELLLNQLSLICRNYNMKKLGSLLDNKVLCNQSKLSIFKQIQELILNRQMQVAANFMSY